MKKFFGIFILVAGLAHSAYAMQEFTPYNINQKDSYGQSPLYYAVASCDVPVVEGLLSRFPNINTNARNKDGTSIFELSVLVKSPEIMNLILKHPRFIIDPDELGYCLLRTFCRIKKNKENEHIKGLYVQIAQILINHDKTNVNFQDWASKYTPLLLALETKCFGLAKALILRKDINLLKLGKNGKTWAVDILENYAFGGLGATTEACDVATLILRNAKL